MLPLLFKKHSIPQQHGFTLIEVMVALAIFVIGIVGCYLLQINSSTSSRRSNSVSSASTWAQFIAEDLLARQYSDNNSIRTDPLLVNSKGDLANGLTNLNATSAATSDGVCRILTNGSVIWPALGVNPVPLATDAYSVFWNIIDNRPLLSVKQIHIIVVKNSGISAGTLYTQDYFKLGPI